MHMVIEYYCTRKWDAGNKCHHNIKVDGIKKHIVDTGCQFNKSDLKTLINNSLVTIEDKWIYDCENIEHELL